MKATRSTACSPYSRYPSTINSFTDVGLSPGTIYVYQVRARDAAAGIVVLGFTRPGRALYAIGGNIDAARAAGIRTDRILWLALIVAGTLAALAGLLISGRLAAVPAAQGDGAIFRCSPRRSSAGSASTAARAPCSARSPASSCFYDHKCPDSCRRARAMDQLPQRRRRPGGPRGVPRNGRKGADMTEHSCGDIIEQSPAGPGGSPRSGDPA
jgi:hypothetical protein